MNPNFTIKRVAEDDAERLLTLSRQTFYDAFAHRNAPQDIDAYAAEAFTITSFRQQLSNPDSEFYYAMVNEEIAGYLKLNRGNAQTELREHDGIEVERIYVLQQFQGQKIGAQLIDHAINIAKKDGLRYIWLGVWEHNTEAIRFYERKGFIQFGSHPFTLGSDQQTDLLMKMML